MPRLSFPSPSDPGTVYEWTGTGFLVDGQETPILAYDSSPSGWTEELTDFHEETAGDNHYIDIASRSRAIKALRRQLRSKKEVIIDIGCSSGSMLRSLRKAFPEATLIGSDFIKGPLLRLPQSLPGIPFLQFNLVNCPLFSNSVDAVVLLNVLEHIEEDFAAIQQTFRIIKPGGVLVVEVPAGPHLYDIYDSQLMHFRRYKMKSLSDKLERAGFHIEERSHLGALLYPAFAFVKKRNRRHMECSENVQRKIVKNNISQGRSNPMFSAIMRVEEELRPYVPFPAGIRCTLTCRKPLS